jgi:hypothetical protein
MSSQKSQGKQRAAAKQQKANKLANHPAIGMWADREDMRDVHAWLRKIRAPRYLRKGEGLFSPSRKED